MPISTSSHPLVRLRSIVGWTRQQAADASGMTPANVQNVELGRTALPGAAAARLQAAAGCLAGSLMDKGGIPLALNGRAYERKHFEQWTAAPVGDREFSAAMADYAFRVRLLLLASRGKPAAFRRACQTLNADLSGLPGKLGLNDADMVEAARGGCPAVVSRMKFPEVARALAGAPAFEKATAGKPVSSWRKKECQVVVRKYRTFPAMDAVGSFATSFNSFREEWDVTLPGGVSFSATAIHTDAELLGYFPEP